MISIGPIVFDTYEGRVQIAKKRVRTFASTVHSGAAAQVLPITPEPFQIKTIYYAETTLAETFARTIEGYIGTVVNIVTTITYVDSPYLTTFLVLDVENLPFQRVVRARGKRNITIINISPADIITTNWTLLAVPAP